MPAAKGNSGKRVVTAKAKDGGINGGKPWTDDHRKWIIEQRTEPRVHEFKDIAKHLGRSPRACRKELFKLRQDPGPLQERALRTVGSTRAETEETNALPLNRGQDSEEEDEEEEDDVAVTRGQESAGSGSSGSGEVISDEEIRLDGTTFEYLVNGGIKLVTRSDIEDAKLLLTWWCDDDHLGDAQSREDRKRAAATYLPFTPS